MGDTGDNTKFDIDRRTGQIKTKVVLDHEADANAADNCANRNACVVNVTATDPSGLTDSIDVTINIIGVNEAPVFDSDANTEGIQAPPTVLLVAETPDDNR